MQIEVTKVEIMRRAELAYFKANGWPTHIDGSLKPRLALDRGELRAIAYLYAKVLRDEFHTITIPKRGHREKVSR